MKTAKALTAEWQSRIEAIANGKNQNNYSIKSSFDEIAAITGGYTPGLHVVASAPGQGKTTLVINEMRCQLENGKTVLYVTTEEASEVIHAMLVLSNIAEPISTSEVIEGKLNKSNAEKVYKEIKKIEKTNAFIADDVRTTTEIEKIIEEAKPDMVIIDSLQEVKPSRQTGELVHDLALTAGELKDIALKHKTIILCVSHSKPGATNITNAASYSQRVAYYASSFVLLRAPTQEEAETHTVDYREQLIVAQVLKSRERDLNSQYARSGYLLKLKDTRCIRDYPSKRKTTYKPVKQTSTTNAIIDLINKGGEENENEQIS